MRLRSVVWRAHHPRWSFLPLSGEGAGQFGGRFNRIGQAALYTSFRPETSILEAQQGFPFKAQPMTLCAYRVDCEDILDLTDSSNLGSHDLASGDLSCPWEDLLGKGTMPPSWKVADQLLALNFAGIIVPSFAAGATTLDINVVFWRWGADLPHQVTVVDDHNRLPRDDRSWRLPD